LGIRSIDANGKPHLKVVIQIPCFCEEESLPVTLSALPRSLPGVDVVEWLVVDDGSSDRTVETAEQFGVDHIVSFGRNRGLARAFMQGIQSSLERGADIVVNTDADNQYRADDIATLIAPILANRADIVIGSRPIGQTAHFSPAKRILQKVGSWVVRRVSGMDVVDAPSGFRAFSRDAALSLHVFSRYSYTIETIIQAKLNDFRILSVPIRTNPDLRPSRLSSGTLQYIFRSAETLFRVFALYYPFRFFMMCGAFALLIGLCPGVRFLYYYAMHQGQVHLQSLFLCVIFLVASFILFSIAVLGDVISVNRRLLEKIDLNLRILATDTVSEERQLGTKLAKAGAFRVR
jgi:glycosyltransferase involved in cell wall biosynthesis